MYREDFFELNAHIIWLGFHDLAIFRLIPDPNSVIPTLCPGERNILVTTKNGQAQAIAFDPNAFDASTGRGCLQCPRCNQFVGRLFLRRIWTCPCCADLRVLLNGDRIEADLQKAADLIARHAALVQPSSQRRRAQGDPSPKEPE